LKVKVAGDHLHLEIPMGGDNLIKARGIPQRRWIPGKKVWACRPSLANMQYVAEQWPDAVWDAGSKARFAEAKEQAAKRDKVATGKVDLRIIQKEIKLGLFREPAPWEHVQRALMLGRNMDYFAYFMDQGTGKSRTTVDDAAHNYRRGRVDGLLVLNKNSVKTNWVADEPDPDEPDTIEKWMPHDVPYLKAVWSSKARAAQRQEWERFMDEAVVDRKDGVAVMSVNYEALLQDRSYSQFEEFCKRRRVMIVCDESTRIGYPGTDTTRYAKKLRAMCPLARILTGTPIVQSPLKAYSQLNFLSEDILGIGAFSAFKARYAIMGGYQGRQVITYQNLDDLSEKIASCSYRVLKSEGLPDLPPKVYAPKRRVYMTDEQNKVYADMARTMMATVDDKEATAMIRLTQVMRLQQITGGYVTTDDGVVREIIPPARNPLMQEVLGIMEERGDQKVIVWAHFRQEIAGLVALLKKEGYKVAEFHGGVPERERLQVRRDFKNGKYDVLVANAAAGGEGIDEFKIASLVIYYSNSDKTEQRIQSEDRTHRGGSEIHEKVTYYDIVVPATVRVKLIRTLRNNKSISEQIMKDGIGAWI
jgi:SNF2 family DNA or RNA helicase